jgi:hypothetical protein
MPPEIDPDVDAEEDPINEAAGEAGDADESLETGDEAGQEADDGNEVPQRENGGLDTRQSSRSSERVRAALRERDETRAEIAAIRAELAAVRNRPPEPDPRAIQAERERLALMDPDQRLEYYRHQDQQRLASLEQRLNFRLEDATDRAAFDALQARNPLAAKYASDVEKLLASERQSGRNVSREVALKFIIGEKVMQKAGSATSKQRKAATGRVQQQTTTPRNPGSMSREDRGAGDDIKTLERRLANIII